MSSPAAPFEARSRPKAARRAVLLLFGAALALLALLLGPGPALAAFTPPPLTGHVVDTSGRLAADEVRSLDAKLDRIRRETGFEIVTFLTGSLQGETIEDVAYTTFNTWGIGRAKADNGVLLIIAPNERKVRIETGKGVGGALTDLQSNDILRSRVSPLLQAERFHDAVNQGTSAIAEALTAGTPAGERPRSPPSTQPAPSLTTYAIGAGAFLLVLILTIVSPAFRSVLWFLLRMMFLFGGRGGGGSGFGGGGSGYSGGGGRSGGGGSSEGY